MILSPDAPKRRFNKINALDPLVSPNKFCIILDVVNLPAMLLAKEDCVDITFGQA